MRNYNTLLKPFPFPNLTYYETEIPSLTRISLHVVLTNLVSKHKFCLTRLFPRTKSSVNQGVGVPCLAQNSKRVIILPLNILSMFLNISWICSEHKLFMWWPPSQRSQLNFLCGYVPAWSTQLKIKAISLQTTQTQIRVAWKWNYCSSKVP